MRLLKNIKNLEKNDKTFFDKLMIFMDDTQKDEVKKNYTLINKNNLFNLISIDDLLSNFNHIQPFSLELFLHTGIVPGMFEEKTQVPTIDSKYFKDYLSFYKDLLEALREENYIFDENNNEVHPDNCYWLGKYSDMPHILSFLNLDYTTIFEIFQ